MTPADIHVAIYRQAHRNITPADWPDLREALEWSQSEDARRGPVRQMAMALPVYTCTACGGAAESALALGAAWRLYTLASAVLDDLVDRDKPAAPWAAWDDHRAMHVGLGLIFAAQHALSDLPTGVVGPVLQHTSRYLLTMTQAQATPNHSDSVECYLRHIISKAGVYCGAFAQAGARLVTDDVAVLEALFDFGLAFGVIQQLANDLANLDAGYDHSDLSGGHLTLPLIYGLSQAERVEAQRLRVILGQRPALSHADWDEVRLLLGVLSAREYMARMIAAYMAKAQQALAVVPGDRTNSLTRLLPVEAAAPAAPASR